MKYKTRNDALRGLNHAYGRGDIREIRQFADGRGECIVSLQYGWARFSFRDDGHTVRAQGHQARYSK